MEFSWAYSDYPQGTDEETQLPDLPKVPGLVGKGARPDSSLSPPQAETRGDLGDGKQYLGDSLRVASLCHSPLTRQRGTHTGVSPPSRIQAEGKPWSPAPPAEKPTPWGRV